MKYIDADKIRTEIKRLKAENNCGTDEFIAAKDIAYDKVFDFLEILEEPVSDDLEEAAEKHASEPISGFIDMTAYRAFKAGAGWMAKQQPLPEDSVAFQKGVQEGKRLMMEGATYNELMELYMAIRDEIIKRHRDAAVNIKEKTMDLKEDTGNESALHQIRG